MKTRVTFLISALMLLLFCASLSMAQRSGATVSPGQRGPMKVSDSARYFLAPDLAAWNVFGSVSGYNPQTATFDNLVLVGQVRNLGQLPWSGNRTVTLYQTKNGVTVKTQTANIPQLDGGAVFTFMMIVPWETLNDQSYGCKLVISPGDKNAANDTYTCTAATPPIIK